MPKTVLAPRGARQDQEGHRALMSCNFPMGRDGQIQILMKLSVHRDL